MSTLTVKKTPIKGLLVIEPDVFGDDRGFFFESYSKRDFAEMGIKADFVQDNHSMSSKGVLRGLHFQTENTQAKLVRVTQGAVLDVAVDLRPESQTFGRYFAIELTAENKKMFFIPKRFAHGFLTLEDNTHFQYKCDNYYDAASDGGIIFDDPKLNIDWKFDEYEMGDRDVIISPKDLTHPTLISLDPKTLWK